MSDLVIKMEGGIVQSAFYRGEPVNLYVLDYDTDGFDDCEGNDDGIVQVPQDDSGYDTEPAFLYQLDTDLLPDEVERILALLEGDPA